MAENVVVEVEAVIAETGLWQDCCNLPSGAVFYMVWWKPDGPHLLGTMRICADCGQKERVS